MAIIKRPARVDPKDLNAQQRAAVQAVRKGSTIIIAGAGSGKTKTLVYASAVLVRYDHVRPDNILLLTFTRRAAEEMVERAGALLHGSVSIKGGTFHGFAAGYLRTHGDLIGVPRRYTILDGGDSRAIISSLRRDMRHNADISNAEEDLPSAASIQSDISSATNNMLGMRAYLAGAYTQHEMSIPFRKALCQIAVDYRAHKHTRNQLDFDDMLVGFYLLLTKHPQVKDQLHAQYPYVLLDEYQDTNPLQAAVTHELIGPDTHFMAVGDDAQTIYGFRGSSHKNLFEMADHYPQAKIVKLEENYRSTQPILDLANHLQAQMAKQFAKRLYTTTCSGGFKPRLLSMDSEIRESEEAFKYLQKKLKEGTPPEELVVLYRSNFSAHQLEGHLLTHKVEYQKFGGIRFTEMAHIKDILAHLRVICNVGDDAAGQRALCLLPGIGAQTANAIWGNVAGPLDNKVDTFLQAKQGGNNKMVVALQALSRLLGTLRPNGDPARMVRFVASYYIEQNLWTQGKKATAKNEIRAIENDFDALEIMASHYTELSTFVQDLSLDAPRRKDKPCLTLSTVHSCKGLEWDHVWILHVEDEAMPGRRALAALTGGDTSQVEEELRVLYVAVTRARKELTLSFATEGVNTPSRFLELPCKEGSITVQKCGGRMDVQDILRRYGPV